jgi:hypothetical protein
MNHSLQSADRPTHLRIVSVAFAAAIVVTALGVCSRWDPDVGHGGRLHHDNPVDAVALMSASTR